MWLHSTYFLRKRLETDTFVDLFYNVKCPNPWIHKFFNQKVTAKSSRKQEL